VYAPTIRKLASTRNVQVWK